LMDQPVKDLTELQIKALTGLDEALDRHHKLLGTLDRIGTVPAEIDPRSLQNIALHSSGGLRPGVTTRKIDGGIEYIQTARGKKWDHYEQDMLQLFRCMDGSMTFPVYWAITPKHEMKFSLSKQGTEEEFDKWNRKHRIFVIPSAIFIYAERILLFVKKTLEKNTRIKIGHRWPQGGADFLFKGLRVDGILGDGDFEKFDQSIHSFFINLFYSHLLVYYGPGKDRKILEWLAQQLAAHCTVRLTHLFRSVWAQIIGGLPSGAYCTSHLGSWVLHLLFCLFLVNLIRDLETVERFDLVDQIERALDDGSLWIIVYGDDHITHSPSHLVHLTGEKRFSEWMASVWGMRIRDRRDSPPLLSKVKDGELVVPGVVFLQNYFIKNDHEFPNAPKMLPFRPTSAVVWKAVWGGSGSCRTAADCALSALGIAYTMMGVNLDAHLWLEDFFYSLMVFLPSDRLDQLLQDACDRADMRKYQQFGLGRATITQGFPDREMLLLKNTVNPAYHEMDYSLDDDSNPFGDEMW